MMLMLMMMIFTAKSEKKCVCVCDAMPLCHRRKHLCRRQRLAQMIQAQTQAQAHIQGAILKRPFTRSARSSILFCSTLFFSLCRSFVASVFIQQIHRDYFLGNSFYIR